LHVHDIEESIRVVGRGEHNRIALNRDYMIAALADPDPILFSEAIHCPNQRVLERGSAILACPAGYQNTEDIVTVLVD
jgi:hypothetical protein